MNGNNSAYMCPSPPMPSKTKEICRFGRLDRNNKIPFVFNFMYCAGCYSGASLTFGIGNPTSSSYSSNVTLLDNGNVGIGTSNPGQLLDVNGIIRANEVRVCAFGTCDFVFEKQYRLMPLIELEKFINQNKHLPEIASAKEMEQIKDINLGEIESKLLQKIEELTLYTSFAKTN